MTREASALLLDLSPDGLLELIVWPYQPAGNAKPAGNGHWLDVQVGDQIIVRGRFETVCRVRLYRLAPVVEGEPDILCGRACENGTAVDPRR